MTKLYAIQYLIGVALQGGREGGRLSILFKNISAYMSNTNMSDYNKLCWLYCLHYAHTRMCVNRDSILVMCCAITYME